MRADVWLPLSVSTAVWLYENTCLVFVFVGKNMISMTSSSLAVLLLTVIAVYVKVYYKAFVYLNSALDVVDRVNMHDFKPWFTVVAVADNHPLRFSVSKINSGFIYN